MEKPIKPDLHVKHPYAYLLRSIALGFIILLSSILSSGLLSFDWSNGVKNESTVDAYTDDWQNHIASEYAQGTGSSADMFRIDSAAQLALLAYNVNVNKNSYSGKYFTLTNDIDLSGYDWDPIGKSTSSTYFAGYFYGNGYAISNLTQSYIGTARGGGDTAGLFGYVSGAQISNVRLVNITINATDSANGYVGYVGAIAAKAINSSYIRYNSVVGANISSNAYCTGGLVGHLQNSYLQYSSFVSVVSNSATGTNTYGSINSHVTSGYVGLKIYSKTTTYTYAGGFVGWSEYINGRGYSNGVSYCYYSAGLYLYQNTSGYVYCGGMVGFLDKTRLYNCYNLGSMWVCGTYGNGGEIGVFTGRNYYNSSDSGLYGFLAMYNYSTSFPTKASGYWTFSDTNYYDNVTATYYAVLFGYNYGSSGDNGFELSKARIFNNCVYNPSGLSMAMSWDRNWNGDDDQTEYWHDPLQATTSTDIYRYGAAYATSMSALTSYMTTSFSYTNKPNLSHTYISSYSNVTSQLGDSITLGSSDSRYIVNSGSGRDYWGNSHGSNYYYLTINSNYMWNAFTLTTSSASTQTISFSTIVNAAYVTVTANFSYRVYVYSGGCITIKSTASSGYTISQYRRKSYSRDSSGSGIYYYQYPNSSSKSYKCYGLTSFSSSSTYQANIYITLGQLYTIKIYQPSYGYLYYYNSTSGKFQQITGGPTSITDVSGTFYLYLSLTALSSNTSVGTIEGLTTGSTSSSTSQAYWVGSWYYNSGSNLTNYVDSTYKRWYCYGAMRTYGTAGTYTSKYIRISMSKLSPLYLYVNVANPLATSSSGYGWSSEDGSGYIDCSGAQVEVLDDYGNVVRWFDRTFGTNLHINYDSPSANYYVTSDIELEIAYRHYYDDEIAGSGYDESITYEDFDILSRASLSSAGTEEYLIESWDWTGNETDYYWDEYYGVNYGDLYVYFYPKVYSFRIFSLASNTYGRIQYSYNNSTWFYGSYSATSTSYNHVSVPVTFSYLYLRAINTSGVVMSTTQYTTSTSGMQVNGTTSYSTFYGWYGGTNVTSATSGGSLIGSASTTSVLATKGVGPTYNYNTTSYYGIRPTYNSLNKTTISLTNNAPTTISQTLYVNAYKDNDDQEQLDDYVASATSGNTSSVTLYKTSYYLIDWSARDYNTGKYTFTATYNGSNLAVNTKPSSVLTNNTLTIKCDMIDYNYTLVSPASDHNAIMWYKTYNYDAKAYSAWTAVPAGTSKTVTLYYSDNLYYMMLASGITGTDTIYNANSRDYAPNMSNVSATATYRYNGLQISGGGSSGNVGTYRGDVGIAPSNAGQTISGNFTTMYKQTYAQTPTDDSLGDGDMYVIGTDGSQQILYGVGFTCYAVSGSTVIMKVETLVGGCQSTATYGSTTLWSNATTVQDKSTTTTTADRIGTIAYSRAPYTLKVNLQTECEYVGYGAETAAYILYNGTKYYDESTITISDGSDVTIKVVYGWYKYGSHTISNGTLSGTINTGISTSRDTGNLTLHYTGTGGAVLDLYVYASYYTWVDYGELIGSSFDPTLSGTTYTISSTNRYARFKYHLYCHSNYYSGKTVVLANDLNIGAYPEACNANRGVDGMTFDGQGHTLTGMWTLTTRVNIDNGWTDAGWFGSLDSSTIKNVIFKDSKIETDTIVARDVYNSTISNVGVREHAYVNRVVRNLKDFVSYNRNNSIIENSWLYSAGQGQVFVSYNGATVRNSYMTDSAWSFVNFNYYEPIAGTVANCYHITTYTSTNFIYAYSGTVTNCVTTSAVAQTGVTNTTTANMSKASTFSGFDFTSTWSFSGRGVSAPTTATMFANQPDSPYPILNGFAGASTNTVTYKANVNGSDTTTTPDNGGYKYYIYGDYLATIGTAYTMNNGSTPLFTFGNHNSSPDGSVVFYTLTEGSTTKVSNTARTSYSSAAKDYTLGGNINITAYFDSYTVTYTNSGVTGVMSSANTTNTVWYPNADAYTTKVNSGTYKGAVVGYVNGNDSTTTSGQVYNINGGTATTYSKANMSTSSVSNTSVTLNTSIKSAGSTNAITYTITPYLATNVTNNYALTTGLNATFYNATSNVGTKTLSVGTSTNTDTYYINPTNWNTIKSTITAGSDGTGTMRLASYSRVAGGNTTGQTYNDYTNDYTTRTLGDTAPTNNVSLYTTPLSYNLNYAYATYGVTLNIMTGNYTTAPTVSSVTASNSSQSAITSTKTTPTGTIASYYFANVAVGLETTFVITLNTNGKTFMLYNSETQKSGVSTNTSLGYKLTVTGASTQNIYPIEMFTISNSVGSVDTASAYTTSDSSDIVLSGVTTAKGSAYSSVYSSGSYYMYGTKVTLNDNTNVKKYTRTSWGSSSGVANTTNTRALTSNMAVAPTYSVNTVTVQLNRSNSEYAIPWLAVSGMTVTNASGVYSYASGANGVYTVVVGKPIASDVSNAITSITKNSKYVLNMTGLPASTDSGSNRIYTYTVSYGEQLTTYRGDDRQNKWIESISALETSTTPSVNVTTTKFDNITYGTSNVLVGIKNKATTCADSSMLLQYTYFPSFNVTNGQTKTNTSLWAINNAVNGSFTYQYQGGNSSSFDTVTAKTADWATCGNNLCTTNNIVKVTYSMPTGYSFSGWTLGSTKITSLNTKTNITVTNAGGTKTIVAKVVQSGSNYILYYTLIDTSYTENGVMVVPEGQYNYSIGIAEQTYTAKFNLTVNNATAYTSNPATVNIAEYSTSQNTTAKAVLSTTTKSYSMTAGYYAKFRMGYTQTTAQSTSFKDGSYTSTNFTLSDTSSVATGETSKDMISTHAGNGETTLNFTQQMNLATYYSTNYVTNSKTSTTVAQALSNKVTTVPTGASATALRVNNANVTTISVGNTLDITASNATGMNIGKIYVYDGSTLLGSGNAGSATYSYTFSGSLYSDNIYIAVEYTEKEYNVSSAYSLYDLGNGSSATTATSVDKFAFAVTTDDKNGNAKVGYFGKVSVSLTDSNSTSYLFRDFSGTSATLSSVASAGSSTGVYNKYTANTTAVITADVAIKASLDKIYTVGTPTVNTVRTTSTESSVGGTAVMSGTVNKSVSSVNYYKSGSSIKFTATANAGYNFTNWSITMSGSAKTSTSATASWTISSNITNEVATFTEKTVTITANSVGTATGLVKGGQVTLVINGTTIGTTTDSSTSVSGTVGYFSTVTITASPKANCRFVEWTYTGPFTSGKLDYSSESITIPPSGEYFSANATVTAVWITTKNVRMRAVVYDGSYAFDNGSVATISPSGVIVADTGSSQTFTYTLLDTTNYRFVGYFAISGDTLPINSTLPKNLSNSLGSGASYTLTNITEATELIAVFVRGYTVTITNPTISNGSASFVSGSTTTSAFVTYGDSVNIYTTQGLDSAYPYVNYRLSGITSDKAHSQTWTINSGSAVTSSNRVVTSSAFFITSATNFTLSYTTVYFVPNSNNVDKDMCSTINSSNNPTMNVSSPIVQGASVTITPKATPSGYRFVGWAYTLGSTGTVYTSIVSGKDGYTVNSSNVLSFTADSSTLNSTLNATGQRYFHAMYVQVFSITVDIVEKGGTASSGFVYANATLNGTKYSKKILIENIDYGTDYGNLVIAILSGTSARIVSVGADTFATAYTVSKTYTIGQVKGNISYTATVVRTFKVTDTITLDTTYITNGCAVSPATASSITASTTGLTYSSEVYYDKGTVITYSVTKANGFDDPTSTTIVGSTTTTKTDGSVSGSFTFGSAGFDSDVTSITMAFTESSYILAVDLNNYTAYDESHKVIASESFISEGVTATITHDSVNSVTTSGKIQSVVMGYFGSAMVAYTIAENYRFDAWHIEGTVTSTESTNKLNLSAFRSDVTVRISTISTHNISVSTIASDDNTTNRLSYAYGTKTGLTGTSLVDSGTVVTFTANADTDTYKLSGWYVYIGGTRYAISTALEAFDSTILYGVSFTLSDHTLSLVAGNLNSGSVIDKDIHIEATYDRYVKVYVWQYDSGNTISATFTDIDGNTEAWTNGTFSSTEYIYVPYGSTVTVDITDDVDEYHFLGWYIGTNGVSSVTTLLSSKLSASTVVTADSTYLYADYERLYFIEALTDDANGGSLSFTSSESAVKPNYYRAGVVITFTVTTASGYRYVNTTFSGSDTYSKTATTWTETVGESTSGSYVAHFIKQITITINTSPNGLNNTVNIYVITVDVDKYGNAVLDDNGDMTVTGSTLVATGSTGTATYTTDINTFIRVEAGAVTNYEYLGIYSGLTNLTAETIYNMQLVSDITYTARYVANGRYLTVVGLGTVVIGGIEYTTGTYQIVNQSTTATATPLSHNGVNTYNVLSKVTVGTNSVALSGNDFSVDQYLGSDDAEGTITVTFDAVTWADSAIRSTSLSGSGTSASPYLINNGADLGYLSYISRTSGTSYSSGKYFKVNKDIDLSGYYFMPIMNFAGVFQGNYKTISNLFVYANSSVVSDASGDKASNYIAAMFGSTSSATIDNLTVNGSVTYLDSYTSGDTYVKSIGGLIAIANGDTLIYNVHTDIDIVVNSNEAFAGNSRISSFVGYAYTDILSCSSSGDISVTLGNVTEGNTWVSSMLSNSVQANIENSSVSGNVVLSSNKTINYGSFLAANWGGTFNFNNLLSTANANVQAGLGSRIAGIIGSNLNGAIANISNVVVTGNLTSSATKKVIGGIVGGQDATANIDNAYYISTIQSTSGGGVALSTSDLKDKTKMNLDFSSAWNINASINNGFPYLKTLNRVASVASTTGTFTQDIIISSASDLIKLMNSASTLTSGTTIKLTKDIDLGGASLNGFTLNSGVTLDGQGFTISNATLYGGKSFITTNNGTVKALRISDFGIYIDPEDTASVIAGLVVGTNVGTIDRVVVDKGSILVYDLKTSKDITIGGVVGVNTGTIVSSGFNGDITYKAFGKYTTAYTNSVVIGGVVGKQNNASGISKVYATGNISTYISSSTASSYNVTIGGVMGSSSYSLSNAYYLGDITDSSTTTIATLAGITGAGASGSYSQVYYAEDKLSQDENGKDIGTAKYLTLGSGTLSSKTGVFRMESSAVTSDSNATLMSVADMELASTYTSAGYDFTNVWSMSQYPILTDTLNTHYLNVTIVDLGSGVYGGNVDGVADGTGSGIIKVTHGGEYQLNMRPNDNYEVDYIKIDDVEIPESEWVNISTWARRYSYKSIIGDHNVEIKFKLQSFVITTDVMPDNTYGTSVITGTVVGQNESGQDKYEYGSTATIVATTGSDTVFMYWTLNGTKIDTASTDYTFSADFKTISFTVKEALAGNYSAVFEKTYIVTTEIQPIVGYATADEIGNIVITNTPSIAPSGYLNGENIVISSTANYGYTFSKFILNGSTEIATSNAIYTLSTASGVTTLKFDLSSTNAGNYVAVYTRNPYTITLSTDKGLSVTGITSGGVSVSLDSDNQFTAYHKDAIVVSYSVNARYRYNDYYGYIVDGVEEKVGSVAEISADTAYKYTSISVVSDAEIVLKSEQKLWTDDEVTALGDFSSTGSGTSSSPFVISTAEQLGNMAKLCNNATTYTSGSTTQRYNQAYYIIKSDSKTFSGGNSIDLSTRFWVPLGTITNVFVGQIVSTGIMNVSSRYAYIYGVYVDTDFDSTTYTNIETGFFGRLNWPAHIDGLNLMAPSVIASDSATVGIFVNTASRSLITNSAVLSSDIDDSRAYGQGTIVGSFAYSFGFGTISQCGSVADIVAKQYGAFVYFSSGSIVNCYNVSNIESLSGTAINGIGLVCVNTGQLQNCFSNITTGSKVYRYATTYNNSGTITNCYTVYTSGNASYNTNSNPTYEHSIYSLNATTAKDKANMPLLDFSSIWNIDSSVNGGYPYISLSTTPVDTSTMTIANKVVTISTANELFTLAKAISTNDYSYFGGVNINATDYTISLSNDIDLSGYNMIPIGTETYPFKATFGGNNYTIHNVFIDKANTYASHIALFGVVAGTVKDLNITVSSINGYNNVAGMVGTAQSTSTIYRVKVLNESVGTDTRYGSIVGGTRIAGAISKGAGSLNYIGNEVNIFSAFDGQSGAVISILNSGKANGLYANVIGLNYMSLIYYSSVSATISNSYVNYKSYVASWDAITSKIKLVRTGTYTLNNVYASINANSTANGTYKDYISSVFNDTGVETMVNNQVSMTATSTYPTFDFDSVWTKISGENDEMPVLRGFYGHSIHIDSNAGTEVGSVDTYTDTLGNAYALHGEDFDIKVTPYDNWHIGYVLLDGEKYLSGEVGGIINVTDSVITISNVIADHEVYIYFEIDKFDYTINGTLNLYTDDTLSGITLSGDGTYDYGSTVTLTVSYDMTVYRYVKVTKNDEDIDTSNSIYGYTNANGVITLSMTANGNTVGNYNVVFVRHFKLTLTTSLDELGNSAGTAVATTTPNAYGISIGEYYYDEGTSVEIVATPNEGVTFVGWYAGSTSVSTSNPYTFVMNGTTNYLAQFETIYYVVSVEALGNYAGYGTTSFAVTYWKTGATGSVTPDESGNIRLSYGAKLVMTIDPDYRFKLSSLTLDSVEQTRAVGESESTLTIEKLVGDMAITYTFNQDVWRDHYSEIPSSQISGTTYTIKSAYELAWVLYKHNADTTWSSGKTFVLGTNIDLDKYYWTQFNLMTNVVFDGAMYTIDNLNMLSYDGNWNAGMFRSLTDSTIKNIVFTNVNCINSTSIVTRELVNGTIDSCYILSGQVSYKQEVGSFVDHNYGIIKNCINYANVNGNEAGGISKDNNGLIENCTNYGTINANYRSSGITISSSSNTQTVTIVDNDEIGAIKNCMNYGYIISEKYTAFGIAGLYDSNTKIINAINYGTAKYVVYGTAGTATNIINMDPTAIFASGITYTNCYTAGSSSLAGVSAFSTADIYTSDMFRDITFGGDFVIYMGTDGLGTKTDANNNLSDNKVYITNYMDMIGMPILRQCVTIGNWSSYTTAVSDDLTLSVSNARELSHIMTLVNSGTLSSMSSRTISITKNIDLFGHFWTPIGYNGAYAYTGKVDGNDYVIDYMTLVGTRGEHGMVASVGLFGLINTSGLQQNVNLGNVLIDVTDVNNVGAYVGYVSSIFNATNINNIGGEINVKITENASNQNYAFGGVIGYIATLTTNIKLSHNDSNINVDIWSRDGISADTRKVGGIVGRMWSSTDMNSGLDQCYNTGDITGVNTHTLGGIAGLCGGYNITNSYNTGNITANTGNIYAISQQGYISNCYNAGTASSMGGWTQTNCYYLTGTLSSTGVTALTSEAMKSYTSYDATWDFLSVWTYVEGDNDGYPVLMGNYDYVSTTVKVENADLGIVNVSDYAYAVSPDNLDVVVTTNDSNEVVWTFTVNMLLGTTRTYTFSTPNNESVLKSLTLDGVSKAITSPLEVSDTSKGHSIVARFDMNMFTITLTGSITASEGYTVPTGTRIVFYLTQVETGRTFVILLSDGQTKLVHNLLVGEYKLRVASIMFFNSTITTPSGISDTINLRSAQTITVNMNKYGDKWLHDSASTY